MSLESSQPLPHFAHVKGVYSIASVRGSGWAAGLLMISPLFWGGMRTLGARARYTPRNNKLCHILKGKEKVEKVRRQKNQSPSDSENQR